MYEPAPTGCFGKRDDDIPPAYDPTIGLSEKFKGPELKSENGVLVSGNGSIFGDSPVLQDKAYFEVTIRTEGTFAVGVATKETALGGVLSQEKVATAWTLTSSMQGLPALPAGSTLGVALDQGDFPVQVYFYLDSKVCTWPTHPIMVPVRRAVWLGYGDVMPCFRCANSISRLCVTNTASPAVCHRLCTRFQASEARCCPPSASPTVRCSSPILAASPIRRACRRASRALSRACRCCDAEGGIRPCERASCVWRVPRGISPISFSFFALRWVFVAPRPDRPTRAPARETREMRLRPRALTSMP